MDITTKKKFREKVIDAIREIDIDIFDDLRVFKKRFSDGGSKKIQEFVDYYNALFKFRSNLVNLNKELKVDVERLEEAKSREEIKKIQDKIRGIA